MYTSLVLGTCLLTGSVAEAAPGSLPWQTDYSAARRLGKREQKPLAVFVGSGPQGWRKVSQDGQLSPKARQVLADHYVCVYADTEKEAGQRLAKSLEIGDGAGLVLSDRSVDAQAFRHEGKLSTTDLESKLRKYADTRQAVRRTETLATQEVRYYYPPARPAAPAAAPFRGFGGFGGSRGGC